MAGLEVVICGGGIAGVEGLLRLRKLAGERVSITLLSGDGELAYRPLAVREPFGRMGVQRYPLDRIAADTGAELVHDRLAWVDRRARALHTAGGASLSFDALLLAVGARERAPYQHAQVFNVANADQTFHGLVQDLELGYVKSIAFVQPEGPSWPLPLYELALMTAEQAHGMSIDPEITVLTPEESPLAAFGGGAGQAVAELLTGAGIGLRTGARIAVPAPRRLQLDGEVLEAERIVTLPRITGPAIRGIPAGTDWFIPIDQHCVVRDTEGRIFAAGDATDFPVKFGGIGAQQADAAAAGIARLAGAGEEPPPLQPVIRGMLLTGREPLYLAAQLVGGRGWHSEVYRSDPPWPADEKVVAEELGPYLSSLQPETAPRP
jgi:sulfide:quinone oxidoreductase